MIRDRGAKPHPHLGKLSAQQFLTDYWRQSPFFAPRAFAGLDDLVDADELAGAACESGVDARLVLGGDARLAIGDARQLMAELSETARALSATGEAVNEMIAENREPIADFTQDGLYEFSSMIDEIRILVSSLTRIAEQLEADPSGYLLGGSQQGFEAE